MSISPPQTSIPFRHHFRREWIIVLAITLLTLGFNLLTFDLFPTIWSDDVSFSEPAFNFALHGSYTTTVWQFQPLNTFPVVNCPLYPMILAGWLWLLGADLLTVRLLNDVLISVAGLLFWQILLKFGLVRSVGWRIALIAAFSLGTGISFAYRCSRPDPLGIVLTLVLALTFTIKSNRTRNCSLFAVAVILPWVSLTSGLFAGLACFFSVLIMRQPKFSHAMVVWTGLILGVVSVFGFFYSKGILQYFVAGASQAVGNHYVVPGQATKMTKILSVLHDTWPEYLQDHSTDILLVGTFLLLGLKWIEVKTAANWRLIGCCALLIVVPPPLFNFVGNYSFFYSYTLFIPALIIFANIAECPSLSESKPIQHRLGNAVAVATFITAALLGLPLRLAMVAYFTDVTPQPIAQRSVNSKIHADDVVFSDESGFFLAKSVAKVVYTRWSSMDFAQTRVASRTFTPAEKASVTKLLVQPDQVDSFTKFFGGEWEAMAGPFGDSTRWERLENIPWIKGKLKNYFDQGHSRRRQLQIFRRQDPVMPQPAGQ